MTSEELKEKQDNKKFNLVTEFRILAKGFEEMRGWIEKHDTEAAERHKVVDADLRRLDVTIAKLPCETELVKMQGIEKRIDLSTSWKIAIVVAIVGMLGLAFEYAVKFGSMGAILERNTVRILHLEDMHMSAEAKNAREKIDVLDTR
jgi:hypothetical protein